MSDDWNRDCQNVLNRMKKSYDAGRGVRISADELQSLSVTMIGQMWEDPEDQGDE